MSLDKFLIAISSINFIAPIAKRRLLGDVWRVCLFRFLPVGLRSVAVVVGMLDYYWEVGLWWCVVVGLLGLCEGGGLAVAAAGSRVRELGEMLLCASAGLLVGVGVAGGFVLVDLLLLDWMVVLDHRVRVMLLPI